IGLHVSQSSLHLPEVPRSRSRGSTRKSSSSNQEASRWIGRRWDPENWGHKHLSTA
ncbi:hypothetical protein STEG23_002776, partial [Scotinomys teguina]